MAAVAAIETDGLVKRFGETLAVDDLSMRVEQGAVRGLLGRNGAGKTTVFRILFGLLRPESGSVRLFGRDAKPDDVLVRDGIAGFVEEPRFYPYLSARRNLELLGQLDGDHRHDAGDLLELVGLGTHVGQKVGNFSTGMRQRLGLAASLLRRPRLLLLDEPTIGLDPASAATVRALIRQLADHGVTVFLSSHNMSEVDELCDTVVIVDRGRVVWDGTLERLRHEAPAPAYTLVTTDDGRAFELGRERARLDVTFADRGRRLTVRADDAARNDYVVALGRAGIAVQLLEPVAAPLEALFEQLTGGEPTSAER